MSDSSNSAVLELTDHGFYCAAGDFYIDPWQPVQRAVITHAHSDHARWGSKHYLCAAECEHPLRLRLGEDACIKTLPYGDSVSIGGASVSLHPAGHILGSAQVRVEVGGEVWVVSGDYKTRPDATCTPFEPVTCHTFITECTFGLPIYRWDDDAQVFAEINEWWRENQDFNRTSVVYAYALGKAQRVLSGLDADTGPILVHGAVQRLIETYRAAGIDLPDVQYADPETAKATRGRAMVIAPPSAAASPWLRKFGDVSTAFVSGWMRIRGTRRRRNVDRGFVLSDHVDWPGLHDAIAATGAQHIGVTHGCTDVMSRRLRELGYEATIYETRFRGELDEADDEVIDERAE